VKGRRERILLVLKSKKPLGERVSGRGVEYLSDKKISTHSRSTQDWPVGVPVETEVGGGTEDEIHGRFSEERRGRVGGGKKLLN